jgi:CHAT domain-containing protein
VGRWVLDGGNPMAGALETTIEVSRMLTVVGHYGEGQRWTRLPEAEAEGEYLSANFGAQSVTAEGTEIEALLRARLRPPPQLMHFACHGTSADGANALVINDGALLPEYVFERCKAGSEYRPFVFLNACRGGAAQTQLARYGGFAATLLRAGCRGFIGPLWDVNDKIALEVATTFYSEVAAGVTPAEILRSIRAGYVDVDGRPDPPSTLLAYVYYGHPAALITGIHKKPS